MAIFSRAALVSTLLVSSRTTLAFVEAPKKIIAWRGWTIGRSMSTTDIASHLEGVRACMRAAEAAAGREHVELVAVSKTKPLELLQAAYHAGQRVFGENYVVELIEKLPQMPDDVEWHLIGPLQSNKVQLLIQSFAQHSAIDRLTLETLASIKLANKLQKAVEDKNAKLKVYLQVNTSGEDSKSGLAPEPAAVRELIHHIHTNCPALEIQGLMTIGAVDDTTCFDRLTSVRNELGAEVGLWLRLSMGMSGDFETAIEKGADSVRVGSTIFGEREYSQK